MITWKINVMKIDKSAMFKGEKGTYIDGAFIENKGGKDQFGNDGFITQDIGKDRRAAGERGPIIGNWKRLEQKQINNAGEESAPF